MTAASSSTTAKHANQIGSQSYKIITQYGDMLVVKQGIQHHHHHQHAAGQQEQQQPQQQQQARPIIMTFHDLGLNSELQFARFCECDEVKLMLQTFTMIHVNFIGQEFPVSSSSSSGGGHQVTDITLPDDFKYPSVEQMAESIVDICTQLRVRSFIGLAVGAGAHIVSCLALMRPDLVDGLFLINPVVTSCSITEWLYFKMSAISSNHHIGGSVGGSSSGGSSGSSGHHHHNHHHHDHHHNYQHHSRQTPHNHDADSPKKHQSGIRKLLHAAHIHLPHHHHHHNQQQQQSTDTNDPQQQQQLDLASKEALGESKANEEDTNSVAQSSTYSTSSSGGTPASLVGSARKHQAGSRLRRLILSRNFRLSGGHHHQQQPGSLSRTSSTTSTSIVRTPLKLHHHHHHHHEGSSEDVSDDGATKDSHAPFDGEPQARTSNESLDDSQISLTASSAAANCFKRPPFEYLMYHHFGPASFQRYRRSSDTPILMQGGVVDGGASDSPPKMRTGRGSNDNCSTNEDSPASSSSASRRRAMAAAAVAGKRNAADSSAVKCSNNSCSRSHDSLAPSSSRGRSGSVCMGANYLASFASDRQRHSYMQSVYRHYFYQINPHNLWLFAQSFAKRRTLNLRKDCGAAAHAAAAAAALGTSICTAFIGIAPAANSCAIGSASSDPSSRVGSLRAKELTTATSGATINVSKGQAKQTSSTVMSSSSDTRAIEQTTVSSGSPTTRQPSAGLASSAAIASSQQLQQQQSAQALVAGTKVKRTFTCQTLIMCSSVQMHCERAFKLMSLLNPLQATWIKTEYLLVLEERPDKVCQALRLFLQGIGYSMSTYERRLRLSSANGSAGSADSNGSARSLI